MPSSSTFYFTCSFDDGDIADMCLADLMNKYDIAGTFYIPKVCDLTKKNLDDDQIRELSQYIEIGGHTLNHLSLTNLNNEQANSEIINCKNWLENAIEKEVNAFCPPNGKFNTQHEGMINNAGFETMRTTEMLQTKKFEHKKDSSLIVLPTTVQTFDHSFIAYFKNVVKRFNINLFPTLIKTYDKEWQKMAFSQVEILQKINFSPDEIYYFHLWGHSWEIDQYNLWDELESFFKFLRQLTDVKFCTNTELATLYRDH